MIERLRGAVEDVVSTVRGLGSRALRGEEGSGVPTVSDDPQRAAEVSSQTVPSTATLLGGMGEAAVADLLGKRR